MTDGYKDPAKGGRCALGEGDAPLFDILDQLAPDVPLSLEWPAPSGSSYTDEAWAKFSLDGCKAYLAAYQAARSAKK
jgi:hypothetical protein